jgi:hypothetical protein
MGQGDPGSQYQGGVRPIRSRSFGSPCLEWVKGLNRYRDSAHFEVGSRLI